jgi:hypothetical protein
VHSSLLRVIDPLDERIQRAAGRKKDGAYVVNRNGLYLVIGALVVAIAVLGIYLYQERQKTTGIEINVDKGGISVETK